MSIIKELRDFFVNCPLLEASSKIGVDFLGPDAVEYTIEQVPCDPIVTRYIDGGTRRQYLFVFASREAYGADALNNMANCGFYEQLADWLETQNIKRNYPALPAGKIPISITAITSGYLFNAGPETGRYQIQCRLTYTQEV